MRLIFVVFAVFVLALLVGCSTENMQGEAYRSKEVVKINGELPSKFINGTNSTGNVTGNNTGNVSINYSEYELMINYSEY